MKIIITEEQNEKLNRKIRLAVEKLGLIQSLDMFGKDISDIIIMSNGYLKFYKSKTNGRFTESEYQRIAEIFNEKKE